jgi:hypothetical protein
VRLYVGATDPERQGAFLPVGFAPLPTIDTAHLIKDLLGPASRIALLSSPDLLAQPAAEQAPGDFRPDPTSPSLHGEQPEADSLEADSLEAADGPVGEEE